MQRMMVLPGGKIFLWLDHNLKHKVFNPVLETKDIVGHQNAQEFRAMKKQIY